MTSNWQTTAADNRHAEATAFYNRRYNNHVYQIATQGKSIKLANALLDDAMALCGSPFYKISHRAWSETARDFLALFT